MCGRYVSRAEKQQIAKRAKGKSVFAEPDAPNYNVAPSTFQAFVRDEREREDRELVRLWWKLIPHTAPSLEVAAQYSTINARSEGVTESNWYRQSFETRGMC